VCAAIKNTKPCISAREWEKGSSDGVQFSDSSLVNPYISRDTKTNDTQNQWRSVVLGSFHCIYGKLISRENPSSLYKTISHWLIETYSKYRFDHMLTNCSAILMDRTGSVFTCAPRSHSLKKNAHYLSLVNILHTFV